jgi:hypothetical protein
MLAINLIFMVEIISQFHPGGNRATAELQNQTSAAMQRTGDFGIISPKTAT